MENDYKVERIAEARQTKRDLLMEEFESGNTDRHILKEILENASKDDIIDWLFDLSADDSDFFQEWKQEAFNEYCEHRD